MALIGQLKALLTTQPSVSSASVPVATPGNLEEPAQPRQQGAPRTPSNPLVNKFAQSCELSVKATNRHFNASTKEINITKDIIDKINYMLQEQPQLGNGQAGSKVGTLKLSADECYQVIGDLKNIFDELSKQTASQETLAKLEPKARLLKAKKDEIVLINTELSKIFDNIFSISTATSEIKNSRNIFINQKYLSEEDNFKQKVTKAGSDFDENKSSFVEIKKEIEKIKTVINGLFTNKEKNSAALSDNLEKLVVLKFEKAIPLQQAMENNLYPLWITAADKHTALMKRIDENSKNKPDLKNLNRLNEIKSSTDQEFLELVELHKEYQEKLPVNKLLSEEFGVTAKETKNRLKEIMETINKFSEKSEKLLKEVNSY